MKKSGKKKKKNLKMVIIRASQWKKAKFILEEICRREKLKYELWCSEFDLDVKDLKGNAVNLYARAMLALGREYEYTVEGTSDR